jgi:hypothetical protein
MMRTSARQVSPSPTPFLLSATRCSVCGGGPVVILASGRNDNGAVERFYCGFAHANLEGWPWLGEHWRRGDDLLNVRIKNGEKTE